MGQGIMRNLITSIYLHSDGVFLWESLNEIMRIWFSEKGFSMMKIYTNVNHCCADDLGLVES